ncbi:MAG: hypothetical protein ACLTSG_06050 [Lachnospiraceae bacterium]
MTLGLMSAKPAPDAVICANNLVALGCVAALKELGSAHPRGRGRPDLWTTTPFSRLASPELTGRGISTCADHGRPGCKAARGPHTPPEPCKTQSYTTASNLIIRASTRKK